MRSDYDASSIEVLSGLEPVRKRPGMYTDTSRPNHLAQEVIDNSVDEAIAGYASRVDVTLFKDGSLQVSDDGRGMPVDMQTANKAKRSPALSLMPLSFATILGGMVTLIGTPTNIVISQFRETALGEPFSMFDFAPVGLVCSIAGVLFGLLLFGGSFVVLFLNEGRAVTTARRLGHETVRALP